MSSEPRKMIYLDNAATTPLEPAVREVMLEVMDTAFGNPSSVHEAGRKAKVMIEEARRQIASWFNARTSEIYFTSGGTEALVTALRGAVHNLGIRRIITSRAEHSVVLHTVDFLEKNLGISVDYVDLEHDGAHDLRHLEELLALPGPNLVSLMHANNVIGTLLPIEEVGHLCRKYNAIFLCDTVQTIGKYSIDLKKAGIHLAASSAHKYHGPKGSGFLYVDKSLKIDPLILGGGQERGLRSGTENTYGVVGMQKAIEIAYTELARNRETISELKRYAVERLRSSISKVRFVGNSDVGGLYNMIYIGFPDIERAGMLQFNLDMAGIAVSTGSACSSGASKPSHVMQAIRSCEGNKSIRISFSKYNTKEEVDTCVMAIREYLGKSEA